jgi:hypothetical protein
MLSLGEEKTFKKSAVHSARLKGIQVFVIFFVFYGSPILQKKKLSPVSLEISALSKI